MISDRIFGAVVTLVALAYIASATQIQTSFLSDPVGPKTFPMLIGAVAAICGIIVVLRPDEDPEWPQLQTLGALVFSVIVLVCYAYALKPLGFLLPTAVTAAILSYQISRRSCRHRIVAGTVRYLQICAGAEPLRTARRIPRLGRPPHGPVC
jgi:putative tricarboxylic transport membrane protein